jgi:hypothetical protein
MGSLMSTTREQQFLKDLGLLLENPPAFLSLQKVLTEMMESSHKRRNDLAIQALYQPEHKPYALREDGKLQGLKDLYELLNKLRSN